MEVEKMLNILLDSWNKPVVFVDNSHTIIYINKVAKNHYAKWGELIGKSIFDCHNDNTRKIILEVYERLEKGEDEVQIVSNDKHRIYMRAVRDENGCMQGYFERYDPPLGL